MQPFFIDCLKNLEELHKDVENILNELPPEALDWSPKEEVNSITALAAHIAGAERFLFGDLIAQQAFDRDRDAEFQTKNVKPDILIQRLADSREYIASVLETLTLTDLDAKRTFHSHEVTVGWIIGHALKHTATHLGNIQVMRDLWEEFKT